MPIRRHFVRNARLLLQSAIQHLVDDPALFAVQVSRRMPVSTRVCAGGILLGLGRRTDQGAGIVALGAVMSGNTALAEQVASGASGPRSRLRDEVAVMLDRHDLLPADARPSTRARAAWMRGSMVEAVQILDDAGQSTSRYAARLRSELLILQPGFRLSLSLPSVPDCGANATHGNDENLRVLHLLTNSLPHTQSGYSLRSHHILTGLRDHGIESVALTRTGYPVMVGKLFCEDEDTIDGICYRRTLPSSLGATPEDRLRQEAEEALRIVHEFRPHVLHATTDYRNALVAQAVSAATGIPWVFEVRGLMEQTWIASHRGEESRALAALSDKVRSIQATEGRLAREANAVVTLSRTMSEVLEQRGVPSARITLVPNGVDESLLAEDCLPRDARARLGAPLGADALAVGAASALVDYEGFDVLLRAAALVIHDPAVSRGVRKKLQVVIVGDGVATPGLADLARELGIAERVVMPGRVPREEARDWVQALDVVVVPRRDLEVSRTVTPQKPVEAMALGRPVVVSDLSALRETITDLEGDVHGVVVPPEDPESLAAALVELLEDAGYRNQLGSQGRTAARERTWPVMMRRYERAYRRVVAQTDEGTQSGE